MMFDKYKAKIKKIIGKDVRYKTQKTSSKLEKLGSQYGGWIVPVDFFNENSVCYLAGAGEDISFDIAMANRFKCHAYIFDPTPKSKSHFEKVIDAAKAGESLSVNNNERYDLSADLLDRLHFFETGLWNKKDKVKFFAPKDDSHVSHSISNLQQTGKYFEAEVDRLSSIMKANNHPGITLLKIDIEGAEFSVIDTLIEDGLDIKLLCVEFHQRKQNSFGEIQNALDKLYNAGYRVIAREGLDFTFTKCN